MSGEHGAVDTRTRAYVEYRVFDRLRAMEHDVRDVEVSLHRSAGGSKPGEITCRVSARLASGGLITATAAADWPYKAIDEAVRALTARVPASPAADVLLHTRSSDGGT